ncbi:MAG: DNA methyltransferase [Bacteroidia bacterium]
MALGWNEIKDRALTFSKEWETTANEEADAKPFLDAFFNVFGVPRRKLGTFEYRVKKLNDADGYIDMLWKGMLLVEMKSRGKNLEKAYKQAVDYTRGLKDFELPKYILVSDFNEFVLYDMEERTNICFSLKDLYKNVKYFGFINGVNKPTFKEQDPANIKAAQLLGKFHDNLEAIGYTGHALEVYLVRVLFCLFAEDTGIFEKQQFQDFITQRTAEDGTDLAAKIQELFQVLNTARDKRFKNLDEQLNEFAYINGRLFEEVLPSASFDTTMRNALLECCYLDWSKISPAIFGSMFQSVMNPKERRDLGAHYTSEKNIMKVIKPLFLDELWAEFEKIKKDEKAVYKFHDKIAMLRFLDPACGCGNFLIITYRELRLLELQVILTLQTLNKRYHQMDFLDISLLFKVNVDKFYGIEYEEFPARIAEVAMWLIDHQMNILVSVETGKGLLRVPLVKSASIVHGNALQTNWQTLLNPVNTHTVYANHTNIINVVNEPELPYGTVNIYTKTHTKTTKEEVEKEITNDIKFDYIFGNPPFLGSRIMSKAQKQDLVDVSNNAKNIGELDYVAGWYIKAAQYIQGTSIKVALVSTNSIVQGLHTSVLWGMLIKRYNIKIHFAHRTFKWKNEAKGNAAVFCTIVGFANFDSANKSIYDYEDIAGEAHEIKVKNINPYLLDAKDVFVDKRSSPICNVPEMNFGNMPADGGEFLFTTEEKNEFLLKEPSAKKYFKAFVSAKEFLNNTQRWCLWLEGTDNEELPKLVKQRVDNVYDLRLKSARPQLAATSRLFAQITQPKNADFLIIPRVSSEDRKYIPIAFFDKTHIASDTCLIIPHATLYHFGILNSEMHMAWVNVVCGRLESRIRYSKDIVYNNFTWPKDITDKQVKAIEVAAQKILDVRIEYSKRSLGDMYKIKDMPVALTKAHNELNKLVDKAYRATPFESEPKRLEYLFELYEKYTADLFTTEKVKKTRKK